jgi:hypothetical protein
MSSKPRQRWSSRVGGTGPDQAARRLESIDNWAEYVRTTPTAVWGEELNRLIDGQIKSAQASAVATDGGHPADGCNPEAIRDAGRATD